jgi:hypothetical protein
LSEIATHFGTEQPGESLASNTLVWPSAENKGIVRIQFRTKVTIGFGPASANIHPDCVIP